MSYRWTQCDRNIDKFLITSSFFAYLFIDVQIIANRFVGRTHHWFYQHNWWPQLAAVATVEHSIGKVQKKTVEIERLKLLSFRRIGCFVWIWFWCQSHRVTDSKCLDWFNWFDAICFIDMRPVPFRHFVCTIFGWFCIDREIGFSRQPQTVGYG